MGEAGRPRILPKRHSAIAAVALLFLSACRTVTIEGSVPARQPRPGTAAMLAGAGKRDITPLPGFSMGGHAIGGKMSRGTWTRLFARAIYFEDQAGTPLLLVSCDLWALPGGLADKVAERIAATAGMGHIGRENLLIAATHTHHSQGNFASSASVNEFAQPYPGYDPELFEFMVRGIADAAIDAYERRRPAKAIRTESTLPEFFRNRSFDAFLLNPEAPSTLSSNANLPLCTPRPMFREPRACRAVDPRLTVLRWVDAADGGGLIGAAAFLATHPTVMSHDLETYSSDVFGVTAVLAEDALRARGNGTDPVVAVFNGAHGDLTTTWIKQDRTSLMRLGRLAANAIASQIDGTGTPVAGPIAYQFSRKPLAGACFDDESGRRHCAATIGQPGASAFGGAEDGRTVLADLGFREGRRGSTRGEYGSKLPALDVDFGGFRLGLSYWLADTRTVPKEVPLGVYRIGDLLIATLPGEFTTTMGKRVAAHLAALSAGVERVLLTGLTNEYVNYFTTPEEYDLQHYEAGMTIYGQASGEVIRHHLGALAKSIDGPIAPAAYGFRYDAGKPVRFGVGSIGGSLYRPDDGLGIVLQDETTGDPKRDVPCACWSDGVAVMADVLDGKAKIPRVRVIDPDTQQTVIVGGRAQDDNGIDIVTQIFAAQGGKSEWCTFWLPPSGAPGRAQFEASDLRGKTLRSDPFYSDKPGAPACLKLSAAQSQS